ncbi:cupredoxin domain-containing protein [Candidatus Woesearchaeota archaeon]|nr:cupredoxin domain-containing protein [Candidatus Woesearchaeota archaeon]
MGKIMLIFILSVLLISACSQKEGEDTIKAKKIIEYHKKKFDNLPLSGKIIDGAREIELKSIQYRWEPDTIVVKKMEKIRFVIESVDVPHGFELEGIIIPNWDPNKAIKKGNKTILEITADEAGTWDMVCTIYCGPGHVGMKGKYIVRE